jgi:hypothetical protein
MRHPSRATAALASALSLALLAACGRGDDRTSARSDTAAGVLAPLADDSATKDAIDDSLAALAGRADVARENARARGLTAKDGLDSAAARGVAASANDTAIDIPGVPNMQRRPGETTGPGGTIREAQQREARKREPLKRP